MCRLDIARSQTLHKNVELLTATVVSIRFQYLLIENYPRNIERLGILESRVSQL